MALSARQSHLCGCSDGRTAMTDALNFAVPAGYRVASANTGTVVECARGCGWKLHVTTLSALSSDARDQLFRRHDAWHNAR